MAFRVAILKIGSASPSGFRRWVHAPAIPSPLGASIKPSIQALPMILPEFDNAHNNIFGFGLPSFSFGGPMELMAVPKKKVSPHKRGIRNGPKALKPTPVIIRCKSCGRVKLPHFYCCSGDRGNAGEQNK
ncbi:hypothetical protein K2173_021166 [Erythroxylum novogranatense]|uniref:Large ribosomal subunit protein bL32m n=1 Tax=Erythroxylum novogranatense TaxID=1862640 RepID=A0AAV8TP39_9ROSI|nr:hypothetical protein K2173_021166 [Erythroxylum novogranatense]